MSTSRSTAPRPAHLLAQAQVAEVGRRRVDQDRLQIAARQPTRPAAAPSARPARARPRGAPRRSRRAARPSRRRSRVARRSARPRRSPRARPAHRRRARRQAGEHAREQPLLLGRDGVGVGARRRRRGDLDRRRSSRPEATRPPGGLLAAGGPKQHRPRRVETHEKRPIAHHGWYGRPNEHDPFHRGREGRRRQVGCRAPLRPVLHRPSDPVRGGGRRRFARGAAAFLRRLHPAGRPDRIRERRRDPGARDRIGSTRAGRSARAE